jgi:hypothetical protein
VNSEPCRQISAGSDLYSLAPFWLQQEGQEQAGNPGYTLQNQQIALGDYSPEKAALYHCRESRCSSEGKRVGREVSGPRRKAGDTSGTHKVFPTATRTPSSASVFL